MLIFTLHYIFHSTAYGTIFLHLFESVHGTVSNVVQYLQRFLVNNMLIYVRKACVLLLHCKLANKITEF